MATKKKNWAQEWLEISKISRKLAKRANQRLVRLERYAKRPGFSKVLSYAYQGAQQYISTNLGGTRYKEHVKLYDINDGLFHFTETLLDILCNVIISLHIDGIIQLAQAANGKIISQVIAHDKIGNLESPTKPLISEKFNPKRHISNHSPL